jgi:hypothetical protein
MLNRYYGKYDTYEQIASPKCGRLDPYKGCEKSFPQKFRVAVRKGEFEVLGKITGSKVLRR